MPTFDQLTPPEGERITVTDGELDVPDVPIVPTITGDGIGPDVTGNARRILDLQADFQPLDPAGRTQIRPRPAQGS